MIDIRGAFMRRVLFAAVVFVAWGCGALRSARAQNDWQFPDPHFGVAEFGRGRPGPMTERQYRDEIGPPGRYSAPGLRHREASSPSPFPRPRLLRPRGRVRR